MSMPVVIDSDELAELRACEKFAFDILASLAVPRTPETIPKLLEEMGVALAKLHAHSVVRKARLA
jgi:hypothetical protein